MVPRWYRFLIFAIVGLIAWAMGTGRWVLVLVLLGLFLFMVAWMAAEIQVQHQVDTISRLVDELRRKDRVITLMSRAVQEPRPPRSQRRDGA